MGYSWLHGITKATILTRGFKQLERVSIDYKGFPGLTKC